MSTKSPNDRMDFMKHRKLDQLEELYSEFFELQEKGDSIMAIQTEIIQIQEKDIKAELEDFKN